MNKKITVLIPVHDTKYLYDTLESIDNQTISPEVFKVLLVLDRVDRSEILKLVSQFNFETEIIISSKPGIVFALNLGINMVKTAYIARIDSDDVMMPNRLEVQLTEMEKDPTLVGLGSSMLLINELSEPIGKTNYPTNSKILNYLLPYRNVFGHPTMFVRASKIREVGMYRQIKSEDWDLWLRLSEVGRMSNVRDCLIKYRIHEGQLSRLDSSNEVELSCILQFTKFLRSIGVEDFPNDYGDFAKWRYALSQDLTLRASFLAFERQEQHRKQARKNFNEFANTPNFKRFLYLLQGFFRSPLEITLLITQRFHKFL